MHIIQIMTRDCDLPRSMQNLTYHSSPFVAITQFLYHTFLFQRSEILRDLFEWLFIIVMHTVQLHLQIHIPVIKGYKIGKKRLNRFTKYPLVKLYFLRNLCYIPSALFFLTVFNLKAFQILTESQHD